VSQLPVWTKKSTAANPHKKMKHEQVYSMENKCTSSKERLEVCSHRAYKM
jgi:hypothetical protein